MLSNTDVGLMMFSPTGQFTSFASKGRIEDIFLRFLDWCDECGQPLENHELLRKSLKHLKYEAEILDKIGRIEELERKLSDLHRKKSEAEEKMRSYNPDMIPKLSISEATHRQQIVMDAIQRIEKLKHEKLLEKEISPSNLNKVEMPALVVGSSSAAAEVTNLETQRNQLPDDSNDKNIEELEPSTS
ncbi:agamous-like MADS-box protein AGL66 [Hibiscus syriacus]|uniref:agamous-like MADS-box protein AGL66 n=1 Tax=Hibiscus syriacus TaxID=106335 RepID=UPI001922CB56|nr:agamous-like MADS-box protein AGL66 [Hibiscus syriacus]